jgi:hypothetical protein
LIYEQIRNKPAPGEAVSSVTRSTSYNYLRAI